MRCPAQIGQQGLKSFRIMGGVNERPQRQDDFVDDATKGFVHGPIRKEIALRIPNGSLNPFAARYGLSRAVCTNMPMSLVMLTALRGPGVPSGLGFERIPDTTTPYCIFFLPALVSSVSI